MSRISTKSTPIFLSLSRRFTSSSTTTRNALTATMENTEYAEYKGTAGVLTAYEWMQLRHLVQSLDQPRETVDE